ncbi:MAG: ABC transporter permease subunit, partial [Clostridia bacterium]|nr:ABC transporter permease subunit [Clostridia bacterium]
LGAFTAVDEGKIFLLRSMGASKLQILCKLVIPHSIASIVDTVKIVIGLAWVGVIMGEYLVSGAGLGYLIIYGGQVFRIDLVMASTVILCVLASLMYFLVALLSKALRRYQVGV